MILAAGLTPAWQYALIFDRLETGEVNRARESTWFASGKAINVGLAVHHLGAPATVLSTKGGTTGDSLARDFEMTGARARWVETQAATRICTTLIDRNEQTTTELVENSPAINADELAAFEEAFAEAVRVAEVIVFSGSLPAKTPSNYYRRLLERGAGRSPAMPEDGRGAKLVLDIRGPELMECLSFRPFLVKPNRHELESTVRRSLKKIDDLLAAMRELNQAGAEWVLVTAGGDAAWLTSATHAFRVEPPDVASVVNPIGCGDCVAAGIAQGMLRGDDAPRCVQLGFGAAGANIEQMTSARFDGSRAERLADLTDIRPH